MELTRMTREEEESSKNYAKLANKMALQLRHKQGDVVQFWCIFFEP